jgi:hypothetical protein
MTGRLDAGPMVSSDGMGECLLIRRDFDDGRCCDDSGD